MKPSASSGNQSFMKPVLKMEPTIIVETLSDAIMRIMKHSKNINFVGGCCVKLEAGSLQDAEKKLKTHLWAFLKYRYGIINTQTAQSSCLVPQQNSLPNEPRQLRGPPRPEPEPLWNDDDVVEYENDMFDFEVDQSEPPDLIELNSPSWFPEACGSFQSHLDNGNLCSCYCQLGIESDFSLDINEDFASSNLTSTPTEKESRIIEMDESKHSVLKDLGFDVSDETSRHEIFRSTTGVMEDTPSDLDIDEMTSSWDSLKLSDTQIYLSPSITDPALHFSRPECLDQSQLVGDIFDNGEEDLGEGSYREGKRSQTTQAAKNVFMGVESDSQNMITTALCELRESMLQDVEMLSDPPLRNNDVESSQGVLTIQRYRETDRLSSFAMEEGPFLDLMREFFEGAETSRKGSQLTENKNMSPTVANIAPDPVTLLNVSPNMINTPYIDRPLNVNVASKFCSDVKEVSDECEIEILFESYFVKATPSTGDNGCCSNMVNVETNHDDDKCVRDREGNCEIQVCEKRTNSNKNTSKKEIDRSFYKKFGETFESREITEVADIREKNSIQLEGEDCEIESNSLSQASEIVDILETSSGESDIAEVFRGL